MKKAKIIKTEILSIERGENTFEDEAGIEETKEGSKLEIKVNGRKCFYYFHKKLSDKYKGKIVYLMIDENKKQIIKLINKKNIKDLESTSPSMFIINALCNALFRSFALMATILTFMILTFKDFYLKIPSIFDFFDISIGMLYTYWYGTLVVSILSIIYDFYVNMFTKTKYIIPYFGYFNYYYLRIKLLFTK